MSYKIGVKDKKVIFSNEVVKNLVLFELEFVTDAPVLCRALREAFLTVEDKARLIDYSPEQNIKSSYSSWDTPAEFRVRFDHPENFIATVSINATIQQW